VSLSVGRAIQQGRMAKGLTQKDLATVRWSFAVVFLWGF
jgi:ribosome-binding protein aMBF1 (putative translation factor)